MMLRGLLGEVGGPAQRLVHVLLDEDVQGHEEQIGRAQFLYVGQLVEQGRIASGVGTCLCLVPKGEVSQADRTVHQSRFA